jgi:hypothetical protein
MAKQKQCVFIVGCPRTGSTFLQSLLAAHSKVYSLPETRFFYYLHPTKEWDCWWRRLLPVVSSKQRKSLEFLFSASMQRQDLFDRFPWRFPLRPLMLQTFVGILDELATDVGKEIILEKTPEHIYHIPTISKAISNAKFVHIVRSAVPVVQSLLDVTKQFSFNWGGEWSLDYSIRRWNEAVKITERFGEQSNHFLVGYSELTSNTTEVLQRTCEFLDLEYEDGVITNAHTIAARLAPDNEPHKLANRLPHSEYSPREMSLSSEVQSYIRERCVVPNSLERYFDGG